MTVAVNMKQLLEAGVHYGHQTRRWNPRMANFIFGARNGIHIIDLQKTVKRFQKAAAFLEETVAKGGHVLFIGTKRLARDMVAEEARRAGQYYVNYRWLGGTLTNYATMRHSIHRLRKIERMSQDGTFDKLTKKEVLGLTREQEKLEQNLGGVKDMPGLPHAIFVVDAHKETIAIREAKRLNIPVVAITDTNADPTKVEYPIPGNDDSIKALKLFIGTAAEACAAGKAQAKDASPEKGERSPNVEEGSFRDDKGNRVNVEKR
jgi:small subunit ribosomal protein S2